MVVSRLDPDINYPEIKQVEKDDINHNSPLYQTEIENKEVTIALGAIKFSFVTKGVLYTHIYLVQKNKVVAVLGVYEFLNKNYVALMDADDDLDITQLTPPLIYESGKLFLSVEEMMEDAEDVVDLLETEEDQFDTLPKKNWVQTFMKNSNYEIEDKGGGGDCLFNVIEAAFKEKGKEMTVAQQRKLLADAVTDEQYATYREFYTMHLDEIKNGKQEYERLKQRMKDLKEAYIKEKSNHARAKKHLTEANEVKKKIKFVKREREAALKIINEEFRFMKNIKTLKDFKEVIQTCNFWADTWAISTLERLLNIKLVLLSSREYTANNMANVLQCGQKNDNVLEKKGSFTPAHYIITDYMGNHYTLIKYKGKGIFSFNELPYGLIVLIANNCMQGDSLYNLIPDFKNFRKKLGGEEEVSGLFNDDIIFQFYSKSQNKAPGEGSGEKIPADDVERFGKLKKIKNWRKVLSNFWKEKIKYDGLTWNSAEHLYHALKFKKGHPEFYKKFSVESGSEFSEDPKLAKVAGGKSGKYSKKVDGKRKQFILRPKNIMADSDFFPKAEKHMKTVLEAKFIPAGLPRDVLKATEDAKLVHFRGRGGGTETWNHLMEIRAALV